MLNPEIIGKRIEQFRKQMNLKQNELADTLYVTHQAVSKWENGKSIPSIEVLYELTKLFNISIDALLDDSEIAMDDYESMLQHRPRDAVISKFLQQPEAGNHLEQILYLLNNNERKQLIDQMISGTLNVNIPECLHLFNNDERIYLLSAIRKQKGRYDINDFLHLLSMEERRLFNISFGNFHVK